MTETKTEVEAEALANHIKPIDTTDTMGIAGKKILLAEFVTMLENEDGSRFGEDIEYVHDMRVAIRKMRSALRLLHPYYRTKPTRYYNNELKNTASHLGAIRDLDVMLVNLESYHGALETPETLQPIITRLDGQRTKHRKQLNKYLDERSYQGFVMDYAHFLTKEQDAIVNADSSSVMPLQVRHVLPVLVQAQLSTVLAYDHALTDPQAETLHALRIEFKRLRYLVTFFAPILGRSLQDYITDLKAIQDHLGNLNDAVVAQTAIQELRNHKKTSKPERKALKGYLQALKAEERELISTFGPVWDAFNRRTVQRRLSDALLVLR